MLSLLNLSLNIITGAVGTYWMLPHRHGGVRPLRQHTIGAVMTGLVALNFMLTMMSPPGDFLPTVFFYVFSAFALVGALLTVTSCNPIYSALWFASVVLSTSGLFLAGRCPVSWPPAR